jgi:hypothetical protein
MLARLGRLVNDLTSDASRAQLIAVAPWLVGTMTGWTRGADEAVAALAGQSALAVADSRTADHLARLLARGDGGRSARLLRMSVRALARQRDADDRLRSLLIEAVNLGRRTEGLPVLPESALPRRSYPTTLPVRVGLRSPDGAESTYVHCTALWLRWPEPLRESWIVRSAEMQEGPYYICAKR